MAGFHPRHCNSSRTARTSRTASSEPSSCKLHYAMPSSHYAILGVPRTFTEDQLKRQYRLLALKYHPDRNRGNEEAAAEKFKEIQAAWSTLSNPEERQAYDAELRDREPVRPPRRRPTAQAPVRPGTSRDGGGGYISAVVGCSTARRGRLDAWGGAVCVGSPPPPLLFRDSSSWPS